MRVCLSVWVNEATTCSSFLLVEFAAQRLTINSLSSCSPLLLLVWVELGLAMAELVALGS